MGPFDDAVRLDPLPDGAWLGRTHPAYANMVGPFGGITAAAMLNAVLLHPRRAGDPVSLTVNFAAPVADGAFRILPRLVRANRSTFHWTVEMAQEGGVVATATAVTALRRPTWSAPEAAPPAGLPSPETLPRAATAVFPHWASRYDMRFVHGALDALDGREQPDGASCLWVRDDPPRPLDALSLAALCDVFFPRILVRRRRAVPVGTVSLTAFFHAGAAMLAAQGDRYLLAAARPLVFRDGFFDQSGELWGADGGLLASTHQVVYFRDPGPAP